MRKTGVIILFVFAEQIQSKELLTNQAAHVEDFMDDWVDNFTNKLMNLAIKVADSDSDSRSHGGSVCNSAATLQTIDEFIAAQCLGTQGNCAFCIYASTPNSFLWPQPTSCYNNACYAMLPGLSPADGNVNNMGSVVCFDNYKDASDRLCIFTNYSIGRSNIAFMDNSTRHRDLLNLITKAEEDRFLTKGKQLCFHIPGEITVEWTHVHIFEASDNPEGICGQPDSPVAYCVEYDGSPTSSATALDTLVQINKPTTCAQ